ncbi:hypothetical protein [Paracoccus laeviglucosivorans]|uniref:hypothetical protein n=1 Tax=Paracoccus laeviglucosivorans TaxID=1197861 RepID=UPI00115B4FB9|nr:hypothetical protein [Paracoccus laeviglucosivorans]
MGNVRRATGGAMSKVSDSEQVKAIIPRPKPDPEPTDFRALNPRASRAVVSTIPPAMDRITSSTT